MHDDVVRSVIVGFGGREIETAGDSFLVVFDSATGAIRCGLALIGALSAIQVPIRIGIHSGEVMMSGDHVRGVAVHAASRILALSGAGEVLVSATTHDLSEGASGVTFESRGRHRLKGLKGEYEVFAAGSSGR
jgi:class 3 adenylate cyclase